MATRTDMYARFVSRRKKPPVYGATGASPPVRTISPQDQLAAQVEARRRQLTKDQAAAAAAAADRARRRRRQTGY